MKLLKRLTSMLLIIAMIGGIAACSKNSDKDSDEGDKKAKKTEKVKVSDDEDPEETIDEEAQASIEEMIEAPLVEEEEEIINLTTDMGVKVDLGSDLGLPDDAEMEVTQMEEVFDEEMDAHYTAYDISIGDIHELDGYVTIRLPYNEANIPAGETAEGCVGALYYNDVEAEWEPVLYDVDTAAKEVVIYTDHFSTYGCFEFASQGKRLARVTRIDEYMLVEQDIAALALSEYNESQGTPGMACREAGATYLKNFMEEWVKATGDKSTLIGNVVTLLVEGSTASDAIHNIPLAHGMIEALGKAGIVCSVVSLALTAAKEGKSNNDIIGMYKDTAYLMVSLSGSATLGTIAAAVWIVDVALMDMGNYAYSKVAEDEMKAYRYYMAEHRRTRGEWKTMFYWGARDAAQDPNSDPNQVIMKVIDDYCNQFWNLSDPDRAEVYSDVGQSGRGVVTQDMRDAITAEFKGELLKLLQPIIEEVQSRLEWDAQAQMEKALNNIRAYLNRTYTIEFTELRKSDDQPYHYAGYQVVFSPLNDIAVKDDWKFVLNSKSYLKVQMTWIGAVMAGGPDEVKLFGPKANIDVDKPELTLPFDMTAKKVELKYEGIPLEELIGIYHGTCNLTHIEFTDEGFTWYKAQLEAQHSDDDDPFTIDGQALSEITKPECDAILNESIKENTTALNEVEVSSDDPASGNCVVTLRFNSEDGSITDIPLECEYADGIFTIKGPYGGPIVGGEGEEQGEINVINGLIAASESDELYILQSPSIEMHEILAQAGMEVIVITLDLEVSKDKEG